MFSELEITLAIIGFLFLITLFLLYKFLKTSRHSQALLNHKNNLTSELETLYQTKEQLIAENNHLSNQIQKLYIQVADLSSIKGQHDQMAIQFSTTQEELLHSKNLLSAAQINISELEKRHIELQQQLKHEKTLATEKIEILQNAKKQLTDEFKILADQIFDQKQQLFTEKSQATIDASLKPMQNAMSEFRQRVEKVHKEDLEGRASLTEQLKQLQALNNQMSIEAQNLTHALKGDSKTQGNWGELILESLLEKSGLREGVEFFREKSYTNDKGKRHRPDVIVNMPNNKHIVIDSKVSLTDYEKALSLSDKKEIKKATSAHVASLKKHIATLAEKRYEHLEQLNAPDFVLLFIPIEGAYLLAIESNSQLFEDAFEKKVAVVTPTTLFTTLKTVEQLWRYERQSENTVKIIKRAAEVHDKFVGFLETFERVGAQLETANNSYHKARMQMSSGNGNLIRQAAMLKDLAGKTKKEIPKHVLDELD